MRFVAKNPMEIQDSAPNIPENRDGITLPRKKRQRLSHALSNVPIAAGEIAPLVGGGPLVSTTLLMAWSIRFFILRRLLRRVACG
jgi:hypothetical protein